MEKEKGEKGKCWEHHGWEVVWLVAQIIVIVLFCTCTTFEEGMRSYSTDPKEIEAQDVAVNLTAANFYGMFMDVHVMIFVGFGFLMVFLKCHSWSSIAMNYICASWALQLNILFQGFFKCLLVEGFDHKINITALVVCEGEFCAGAFLITMGALLGKATFPQLMVVATVESIFFSLNAILVFEVLHVMDIGGAMTIHMFGAYFGLAATYGLYKDRALNDKSGKAAGNYNSQLIAMVGTLFLFIYWPSFNAILGTGMAQQRAIVNTVLSITASTLSSVFISRLCKRKLDMEVVLNATLAGGVMMGAACDLITVPGFAMLAGAIAGIISAFGFLYLNAFCQDKLKLHDTCGVQWLHGVPGTLGAVVSIFCVAAAEYNFVHDAQLAHLFGQFENRSMNSQTWYQIAGMGCTWAISIPVGALTGALVGMMPPPPKLFDDHHSLMHVEYGDDGHKFNDGHESIPDESARACEDTGKASAIELPKVVE